MNAMSKMMATALMVLALEGMARAGVIIDINQVGNDVVATGSGTINTSALRNSGLVGQTPGISPLLGSVFLGPLTEIQVTVWSNFSGPSTEPIMGSGATSAATSGSGSVFGLSAFDNHIVLPDNYISGSLLSATDTFSNQTIASLGLKPGTYSYSWGSGANADTLTVKIGSSSVPEPSSLLMTSVALGMVSLAARFCRKAKRSIPRPGF